MAFQRLLCFGLLSAAAAPALAATTCNGRSEFCSRSYSNISLVGAHDSPFVGDLPTDNQNINITEQLERGVRFLQGQTHKNIEGELDMCHTSCFLKDAGSLVSFLETVKTWLDGNPNEVVTLLITNGDNVNITEFDSAFDQSGIKKYAFVPSSSPNPLSINDWPTLQELIDAGTRLVAFLDYGADMKTVPYILDEFAYYFETPYDVTNASFPDCSINRPPGASADGRMYIVNHFLDVDVLGALIPDREAADTTNAATGNGSIGAQAALCESLYGRPPNVVLVDFTDKGDIFAAQDALNGF
ncbi:hypothetical protein VTN96DRAFT_5035 [Rasamsonia emersonii]|uniref:PLC-like phosphodiesterase n=1 Tax=Rasamsonia emersonii (strain ATCC 16479 / CBS 393.64 / IMI 116815) TaxID=1408163 RepID=A0A0F4Z5A5_RASE3|nr:hypothetical protein T310_0938 [Rasamsonia emersonii CBS 393.64]KKA25073.1 hypothetical protein T310_0938 [Rasamsonia emersonii CBS 393.64]